MEQIITEEMNIHKEWYEQAEKMTMEKLPEFLRHLLEDYWHDYGTICHAMAAGTLATMHAMDNHPGACCGITGFQAGCVMWEFVRHCNYKNNKCGLRMQDMDNLLYPQYDHLFNTISKDTWESVRKEAANLISNNKNEYVHPDVAAHWKSIVSGNIPFGLRVEE